MAEDTILNLMVSRKVIFEEIPEEKELSNLNIWETQKIKDLHM